MALSSKGIYIVGAKRTPFCSYGGQFKEWQACHAFAAAAKDAMSSANVDPSFVDQTVVGNVNYLSQCDGGKTPRYCGIYSGVPIERPALGVNKACGSGLQAIITSAVDMLVGTSNISLVGGTEIMSTLPMLVRNVRFGTTLGGSYRIEDHMKSSPESYTGFTVQKLAEETALRNNVGRAEVDEYTAGSILRWKNAHNTDVFSKEITKVTVNIKKKDVLVDKDQPVQVDITTKELRTLPPLVEDGEITTAGNSSINETFASEVVAVMKHLKVDSGRVNVNGGALAMGHPAAATGARMATHLTHELRRRKMKRGIAASNCGLGQGVAVMLELL